MIKPSEKGLSIDIDETYLLKGDKSSTASYLKTLVESGILTRNEARKQLGYQEMEGCDTLTVSFTNVANNTIGSKDNQEDKNTEEEIE